jgi:isopentenyl-diphosphate delta-isomerase
MNVSFHMELYRCKVSNRHDEQSCPPLNTFTLSPDAVDYLLFLHRDVKVQPNPEEVADIQYVNREQLKEIIRKADAGEDGIMLSPWFRIVADNFLLDWWNRVEDGTLAEAADMATIHKL